MHTEILTKYCFIDEFDTNIINKQDRKTGIIFRNYNKPLSKKNLIELKTYCHKVKKKIFLSNNIKLSIELGFDGAYIPSFNRSTQHLSYNYKKKFLLLGSAHNIYEIRIKEKQSVHIIFLSSVFKKNKNFLGINKFKNLTRLSKLKIIALGGISKKNIKILNLSSCFGFAGISFFR
jgi:thiamine-phosphate pyrophosphorylase